MITRKEFVASSLIAFATASLAACGGKKEDAENLNADANANADAKKVTDEAAQDETGIEGSTLVVAAIPSPNAEILKDYAVPKLKEMGVTLEVKEYTDHIQLNAATTSGEVDANYFQHTSSLNGYNRENHTDLVSAGTIHYEPLGIYSNRHDNLKGISDGTTIAMPNDPANEGRALLVLQQEGLIELNNPTNIFATPGDIVENPHNVELRELEVGAVPHALDDVDFAVINCNFAIENGLHVSDAIAVEDNNSKAVKQYGDIICTTSDKLEDPRIVALVEVLQSEDFAVFLQEKYDQDLLPAV